MNRIDFYTKKNKQDVCDALENWAAQDSNILDEFGAESFSTKQLLQLKRLYISQSAKLRNQQKLLIWFALSCFGWAFLGVAAYALDFLFIAKVIFYMSPLTVIAWLGLLLFQYTKNDRIPVISERIFLIDKELKRRRDVQFF